MRSALFVSNRGRRCGVYQFGSRVFNALRHGRSFDWQYLECSSIEELLPAIYLSKPDIIVLNYHPATLPYAATSRLREYGAVVFCIFHEVHQSAADEAEATFFDFLLCPDPTLVPRNPIIVPVPRLTTGCHVANDSGQPELFTVGSFGFATHAKGFDRLCAQVNSEFSDARIRLNIPPHDSEDVVPQSYSDAVIESCRRAVTKPGIDLVITHDFMDDDALLKFLAGNTINAFLYEHQSGRGIASCSDYAIASGRPLAVSKSAMFRHLHDLNPSICVEDSSLAAIAARGDADLTALRTSYSFANAGTAWERGILDALDRLALSRSVPDGRGFNKILDDRSRHAYGTALCLLKENTPAMLGRKIERANIQQAFALDTCLRLLPKEKRSRILAIGSFEDTAVATLKSMGYRLDEIDPNVNGIDLEAFYRSPSAEMSSYDMILCVSVLEHVPGDRTFMRMTADLLAPDGFAVFTVDFAENYVDGNKKPQADERFYTTADIHGRLMSAMPDCALLDSPTWKQGAEDFEYEGCQYGFAGWVFRKFSGEVLRRSYRDGSGTPVWKQLLTDTAAELKAAEEMHAEKLKTGQEQKAADDSDLRSLRAELKATAEQKAAQEADIWRLKAELNAAKDTDRKLIYNLRADGGSRELQFGLKLARLVRKISWQINPSRRRKWIAKKTATEAGGRNGDGTKTAPKRMRPTRISRRLRAPFQKDALIYSALPRKDSRGRGFWEGRLRLSNATRLRDQIITSHNDEGVNRVRAATSTGPRTIYIFVDHTVSCPVNTGVQRVTRGLSRGLLDFGEKVRFVKWDANAKRCVLIDLIELSHLAQWNGPKINTDDLSLDSRYINSPLPIDPHDLGENSWLLVPEVPSITSRSFPITLDLICWARRSGLKIGFTFYDSIPLRREEFKDIALKHTLYMQHLRLADAVWPISKYVAEDLKAFWLTSEHATINTMPQIEILYLPSEANVASPSEVSALGSSSIFCVGTIEPRKNQLLLIAAFKAFLRRNPTAKWRLMFAGNVHPNVADAFFSSLDDAISYEGTPTDEVLSNKYRACAFTVFPSVEEGFGLPIIESLSHGKPCICANFGAMEEVAEGGGCLTVDVRNEAELSGAIERMALDATFRGQLTADALRRPVASWADYAGAVKKHIDRAGDPKSRLGTIYYWIDSTISFPSNTGIQRVTRQLARELLSAGLQVVPVKWAPERGGFGPVAPEALAHFALWNGPSVAQWPAWQEPDINEPSAWFVMPELPLNLSAEERQGLQKYAKSRGLSTAAVFYDAIPWKMRDIYPPQFANAHRLYMLELATYDLVLPISESSKADLVSFLGANLSKPQSLDDYIVAAVLPSEFRESKRSIGVAPASQKRVIKILCVGTVEPRKNHETLLKAFNAVVERSQIRIELTLAGGSHSIEPALAGRVRAVVSGNPLIEWEEEADDARLKDLHEDCDFTIYPSVEEGFGLPIAESLWYGKPCICANFGPMLEVARDGGCLTVDMRNPKEIAQAIERLATDRELREKLSHEAVRRPLKSWREYGKEVATRLAEASPPISRVKEEPSISAISERASSMRIKPRLKLSVCITTYNRAEWLATSLRNWSRLYPRPIDGVEFLVCDNASTDSTSEVVKPYLQRPDFSYKRNSSNVGMLGNLRETAQNALGQYVWILGDDDLLYPGAIERVLQAIETTPGVALIYLNYSFTRIEDARSVTDFDIFVRESVPIVLPEGDLLGNVRDICARNENFFTAIYTLVLRRDHALNAYSQDTSGRPFSTMLTCIPTTHYILNHMMDEPGVWIGSPQVVVNMNVSWMKYAPLWILERIPEVYELAERKGASSTEVDRWRRHTLPGVAHYFAEIYESDPIGNSAFFSPARLVRRFKHLSEFDSHRKKMFTIYEAAWHTRHPAAAEAPALVFP